jgi:hypothetical protein
LGIDEYGFHPCNFSLSVYLRNFVLVFDPPQRLGTFDPPTRPVVVEHFRQLLKTVCCLLSLNETVGRLRLRVKQIGFGAGPGGDGAERARMSVCFPSR